MPRFYFDIRSGDTFTPDEEGVEFANTKEARSDASQTLGEMINDAMPNGEHCEMAVEVRGPDKRALFKLKITFEVEPLADDGFPAYSCDNASTSEDRARSLRRPPAPRRCPAQRVTASAREASAQCRRQFR